MTNSEPISVGSTEVDLELVGIRKSYEHAVAVDDLDLKVMKGEFLFLLGPSGCGKTTTLRMIAGLIRPDTGKIFIRGKDVSGVPAHKRGLGMVFQDYALFPHMSVFGNVAFGLRMKKVPRSHWRNKVEHALELARLEGLEERYPKQLSGGQQQRVALARALVIEPMILLLDEPLSNLDLKLRQQMRVELRQLQERLGITTIFVTHDQEESLSMGDRIAVMERGRINQLDSPRNIYEFPRSRFIADFIGESNFFRGNVTTISDSGDVEVKSEEGFMVRAKTPMGVSLGQQVSVAVRPEKMSLLAQPISEHPNCVPCEVSAVVFMGSYTRFHLSLLGGTLCIVQQQNVRGARTFRNGDRAYITWAVEDGLVIMDHGQDSQ